MAVTEAVANVVLHAYPGGAGTVTVAAENIGDDLVVVVSDNGAGGHSFQFSASAGLGLGLVLIRKLCASVTVVPTPEGTVVTMRFTRQA